MRYILTILAMAACMIGASASAQSRSPIMEHYRAYQAAIERNDLTAAENAAASALAAAEALSDRRTAALALNLATVRFLNRNPEGAIEPATRAAELADAGAPNVAPALARLVLARAELGAGRSGASSRLTRALETAQAERLPAGEIYDGAVELAAWSFANQRYDDAEVGWSIAENYPEGSRISVDYARGRAKVGRAASMVLHETVTRRRTRLSTEVGQEAYSLVMDANVILSPLALAEAPSGDVTVGQHAYAEAVAWRAILGAKLDSDRITRPAYQLAQGDAADGTGEVMATPMALTRPRCMLEFLSTPAVTYPRDAVSDSEMAGLALRARINEAGEVLDARVLVTVGGEQFTRAIESVTWRVRRLPESQPNCRMEMTVVRAVIFRFS